MTETLNCVFIPTNFFISDVTSIVLYVQEQPKVIPSLQIIVGSNTYKLSPPAFSNGRLVWGVNTVCDFYEEAPECDNFKIQVNNQMPINYILNQLVFLGPTKNAKPPQNVYLLEFVSGIYARSSDYKEETVSFSVDSILTLDYRNIIAIQQQLGSLSEAQHDFEVKKNKLVESGIDLNKLSNLKSQYEECMREKRRAQYEFEQQNQRVQAETIHTQYEAEAKSSMEALTRHIKANKQKQIQKQKQQNDPNEINAELQSYQRLLKFRMAALNELSTIFPFRPDESQLCDVHYKDQPQNSQEWNELKAFLGFTTHYIREVSRVVGTPLQYNLIPLAASSRIIDRMTDKKWQIPAENNITEVGNYKTVLVACAKHILETLQMELPKSENLIEYMVKLQSINKENLETLIPKQMV